MAVRNKYAIKQINQLLLRKQIGKDIFYSTKEGEVNSKEAADGGNKSIDTVHSMSS